LGCLAFFIFAAVAGDSNEQLQAVAEQKKHQLEGEASALQAPIQEGARQFELWHVRA